MSKPRKDRKVAQAGLQGQSSKELTIDHEVDPAEAEVEDAEDERTYYDHVHFLAKVPCYRS